MEICCEERVGVCFKAQYTGEKKPRYPLDRRLGGLHSLYEGEEKNLLPLLEIEPQPVA
jgi:hypothetical protein